MLFLVWGGDTHRPTRDIDLLGYGSNDIATLVAEFNTICAVESDDGLVFNFDSFKGTEIKEDALYQGVRLTGGAELDGAKVTFQIDIGFGDAVTPEAEIAKLPSFLDLPEAELKVYPGPYSSCRPPTVLGHHRHLYLLWPLFCRKWW